MRALAVALAIGLAFVAFGLWIRDWMRERREGAELERRVMKTIKGAS